MEKVLELLQDEAFVAELDKLEKEEDIVALFESRGATVTMDQLRELIAQLPDNGDVSDDDLEKVSGGVSIFTIVVTWGKLTRTVLTFKSRWPYCCVRW
jgi:hypothetical protein